ncbi:adenylate/guanylate cyclase catalytic domain protein [Oesophagostomum dentatum]|uniref:Adenylate/guanylate cyclase catalytic domain protein n=1 Tax=Oesophagostomum dentatum TaxID=61180 RepID=A0A0B1TPQ5_OESDE|nr:adenylate/guanylate cyclase catalytic domain protein [Oesophagostomum dentatum]
MVASGVPNENDGRHIIEIAECSLDIREESYTYVVAHCPDFKVRVRIGFHCGPIAAGVIGIRSPRYCLFGDTVSYRQHSVNFASRMQSNCPPNQIQTSEVTALRLMTTNEYSLVKRGIVQVKGKGEPIFA